MFEKHKNHKTYFVPGLYRGLILLESLIASRSNMSSSDLAKKVGVGRSSVFRLIYTLNYMGYTRNSAFDLSIEPGDRLQRLTDHCQVREDVLKLAEIEVLEASKDLPFKINFLMQNVDQVKVEFAAASGGLMPENDDKDRIYSVFDHKLGYAFLSDYSVQDLLKLYRKSDQTKPSFDYILEMISKYCLMMDQVDQLELEAGGRSYFTPVYDMSQKAIAMLEFEGGADMMMREKLKIPDQMVKLSEKISKAIAHHN